MASQTPSEIRVPSTFRIAVCIDGRDSFPAETFTSGSSLQSSRHHKISAGYLLGREAGWWKGDNGGKADEIEDARE